MALKYAAGSVSFSVAAQACVAATQKLLVATAKREHARVMQTNPRPTRFTRIVEGRVGAAEESVKAHGSITYLYPRLDAVVQYAMEVLFDLSPVLSGLYRESHTIFVNGTAVTSLKDWADGDDIVITNTVPYARKIELGVMNMRVDGSSRVYEQAVGQVNARYGNVARALFTWRGIIASGVGRGSRANRSDLRYPAMIFRER